MVLLIFKNRAVSHGIQNISAYSAVQTLAPEVYSVYIVIIYNHEIANLKKKKVTIAYLVFC